MTTLAIACSCAGEEPGLQMVQAWLAHPLVNRVLLLGDTTHVPAVHGAQPLHVTSFFSGTAMQRLLEAWTEDYLLLVLPGSRVELGQQAIERFMHLAEDTGAGLLYSDFREQRAAETLEYPLIDYQAGSLRDTFDFGSVVLIARHAVQRAIRDYGPIPPAWRWGGLYDLRLKLACGAPIVRVPEPLYMRTALDVRPSGERVFDYVAPQQRDYQLEMETVATAHLQRIGAYLEPYFAAVPAAHTSFPVHASVVIPVRNRVTTIADAVRSALAPRQRSRRSPSWMHDWCISSRRAPTWALAAAGTRPSMPRSVDAMPCNSIPTTSTPMSTPWRSSWLHSPPGRTPWSSGPTRRWISTCTSCRRG